MKTPTSLILALMFSLASCNDSSDSFSTEGRPTPKSPEQGISQVLEAEDKTKTEAVAENQEYVLQITGMNFLPGGKEGCDARNKKFNVNSNDEEVKQTICKNSVVELSMVSDRGLVNFEAIDQTTGLELYMNDTGTEQSYRLGETSGLIRIYPENPHGFSYLMVEDITDLDEAYVEKINALNERYSKLKAQEITLVHKGKKVPQKLADQLLEVEAEIIELRKTQVPR